MKTKIYYPKMKEIVNDFREINNVLNTDEARFVFLYQLAQHCNLIQIEKAFDIAITYNKEYR